MGKIKQLEEHIINKIAAGEVVETPASVVKELIENSLDAGADDIVVEVEEGGMTHIRVRDNGEGISAEDARISFERHATSKIASEDDLFSIGSLGFRGEALSSIAAVSKVVMVTRTEYNLEGTRVEVEGGAVRDVSGCGAPKGTVLEVSDLFFNTPARKKYLKSVSTEYSRIAHVVQRYALCYPDFGFKLYNFGKLSVSSPKSSTMLDSIADVYGKETAKDMIRVDYSSGQVRVFGYISKPSLTRSDKSSQSIFVNGRFVKNKLISNAVYDAYHTLLMTQRHPVFALKVDIDFSSVDVNVHPSKIEIKIKDESGLYNTIYEAVRDTLGKHDFVRDVSATQFEKKVVDFADKVAEVFKDSAAPGDVKRVKPVSQFSKYKVHKDSQAQLVREDSSDLLVSEELPLRVVGQVVMTYIVCEDDEGLVLVDQHAAEERVNYERFMDKYFDSSKVQILVSPVRLSLNAKESAVLLENISVFRDLGFDIEEFDASSFVLRSVPSFFGVVGTKDAVMDILSDLSGIKKSTSVERRRESVIIRMSCRSAVKAGKELNMVEMKKIISYLFRCKSPYSCPHGRPTIVRLNHYELEKMFKRVV